MTNTGSSLPSVVGRANDRSWHHAAAKRSPISTPVATGKQRTPVVDHPFPQTHHKSWGAIPILFPSILYTYPCLNFFTFLIAPTPRETEKPGVSKLGTIPVSYPPDPGTYTFFSTNPKPTCNHKEATLWLPKNLQQQRKTPKTPKTPFKS